ncbi:MAG: hypothetical protein GEV09_15460 [Pseudonocardiaceae bacterium]|nr:hypothetical protein [Pseudonocardiaceae bacterium]
MRDVVAGLRLLGRGAGIVLRSRRLLLLGAVPALFTTVLLLGGLVTLVAFLDEIAAILTPFADDWSAGLRTAVRVMAGVAVFVAAGFIGVVTFTALTLLIGGPFYEYLSETVEDGLGGVADAVEVSWPALFLRGLRDSVLLVTVSVLCTGPLLIAGFLPLIGQTVIPVVVACVGGWVLALELVGVPFHRRGLRLGDRHRALRRRPGLTLGVGVPAYLLCAIPFAAIVVMPMAVAGSTLLAREVLGARVTR